MGIFSSLLSNNDTSQSGALSPGTQGLLALSQALFRAGQPSRIPVNTGAALGGALNEAIPTYAAAQSRQNVANSLQGGDLNGATQSMLTSQDPQLQGLGLSTKMNMLTPEYQINMAVMKQMLANQGGGNGGGSGGGSPDVAGAIRVGTVTGDPMKDLAFFASDKKGYFEALAKANMPTDLQKNATNPVTQPYLAKDKLVNTAGGYVPADSLMPKNPLPSAPPPSSVVSNIPVIPPAQTFDQFTSAPAGASAPPAAGLPSQSVQQMNNPSYQEGLKTGAVKNAENIATSKDALDTILSRLPSIFDKTQQMRELAPKTGSGLVGRMNVAASGNNPFGKGIDQGNQHDFETLNNQLFVNELPGLSKGMGRLDLPIINAAKVASQVPEWDKVYGKTKLLDTLDGSLLGGLQASINKYETESGQRYTIPAGTPNAKALQALVDKARNYSTKSADQGKGSTKSTAGIPINAKMGNDGQYYVPDPSRSGKYMRVVTGQ